MPRVQLKCRCRVKHSDIVKCLSGWAYSSSKSTTDHMCGESQPNSKHRTSKQEGISQTIYCSSYYQILHAKQWSVLYFLQKGKFLSEACLNSFPFTSHCSHSPIVLQGRGMPWVLCFSSRRRAARRGELFRLPILPFPHMGSQWVVKGRGVGTGGPKCQPGPGSEARLNALLLSCISQESFTRNFSHSPHSGLDFQF